MRKLEKIGAIIAFSLALLGAGMVLLGLSQVFFWAMDSIPHFKTFVMGVVLCGFGLVAGFILIEQEDHRVFKADMDNFERRTRA